jgi:hypothetical protein
MSKDIATIRIPFYYPGPLGTKKCKNDEILSTLCSQYADFNLRINEFKKNESDFYPLEIEYGEIKGGTIKEHNYVGGYWDNTIVDKFKLEYSQIDSLREQHEALNDEKFILSKYDLAIFNMKLNLSTEEFKNIGGL